VLAGQTTPASVHPRGWSPEYQVKAEYLGVLAEYVNWPQAAAGASFVIGILGASPFEDRLEGVFRSRQVKGKPVNIVNLRNLDQVGQCSMVFICESEEGRLPEVLAALRGRPILTIGDSRTYARKGVMINLFLESERVKFEVNLGAVRGSGFEISSHLLKLAKIVQ
jgi:hypothetical protein